MRFFFLSYNCLLCFSCGYAVYFMANHVGREIDRKGDFLEPRCLFGDKSIVIMNTKRASFKSVHFCGFASQFSPRAWTEFALAIGSNVTRQ